MIPWVKVNLDFLFLPRLCAAAYRHSIFGGRRHFTSCCALGSFKFKGQRQWRSVSGPSCPPSSSCWLITSIFRVVGMTRGRMIDPCFSDCCMGTRSRWLSLWENASEWRMIAQSWSLHGIWTDAMDIFHPSHRDRVFHFWTSQFQHNIHNLEIASSVSSRHHRRSKWRFQTTASTLVIKFRLFMWERTQTSLFSLWELTSTFIDMMNWISRPDTLLRLLVSLVWAMIGECVYFFTLRIVSKSAYYRLLLLAAKNSCRHFHPSSRILEQRKRDHCWTK